MVQRHSAFNLTQEKDYKPALVVRKTADEVVNNSTVFQDDDHLFFAMGANEVWAFQIFLKYNSSLGADLKVTPTYPVGAVCNWRHVGEVVGGGGAVADSYGLEIGMLGLGAVKIGMLEGLVVNGATPGNFGIKWAQWAVEVSDTTIYQNSCIIAHRVA